MVEAWAELVGVWFGLIGSLSVMRLGPDDGVGPGGVAVILRTFAEHFAGSRLPGAEGGSGRRFRCNHTTQL